MAIRFNIQNLRYKIILRLSLDLLSSAFFSCISVLKSLTNFQLWQKRQSLFRGRGRKVGVAANFCARASRATIKKPLLKILATPLPWSTLPRETRSNTQIHASTGIHACQRQLQTAHLVNRSGSSGEPWYKTATMIRCAAHECESCALEATRACSHIAVHLKFNSHFTVLILECEEQLQF